MKWSPQQTQAIDAVRSWLRSDRQIFRLFGYAGTGKTTLAKHLASSQRKPVAFGAFTGKAAKVLQSKGCAGASTIHSMIYDVDQNPTTGLVRYHRTGRVLENVGLVVIDECSMVSEDIAKDLLSFGNKVLVLGDPAQLPPVSGGGYFTDAKPDFMLDEVHRQAAESHILRLATEIRCGNMPTEEFESPDLTITRREALDQRAVVTAGTVLVGKNTTRERFNARLRQLNGFSGEFPQPEEPLICLRNDKDAGLLNGGMWRVWKTGGTKQTSDGRLLTYEVEDMDHAGRFVKARIFEHFFQGQERVKELDWRTLRGTQQFDYGYAITVHKSQGSQWDRVCLFDESRTFGQDRHRWLYTGATRAARHLTLVL